MDHKLPDGLLTLRLSDESMAAVVQPYNTCHDELLMATVASGDVSATSRLLDMGADPNAGLEMSPLTTAVQHGHAQLVKLLCRARAQVNAAPVDDTPLSCAIRILARGQECSTTTVKTLLAYDADVLAQSAYPAYQTPILVAVASGKTKLVKLLIDRSQWCLLSYSKILVHEAVRRGHCSVTELLFETFDVQAETAQEALQSACEDGHVSIVRYLLEAGVPTDGIIARATTSSRREPQRKRLAMVARLLAHYTCDDSCEGVGTISRIVTSPWSLAREQCGINRSSSSSSSSLPVEVVPSASIAIP